MISSGEGTISIPYFYVQGNPFQEIIFHDRLVKQHGLEGWVYLRTPKSRGGGQQQQQQQQRPLATTRVKINPGSSIEDQHRIFFPGQFEPESATRGATTTTTTLPPLPAGFRPGDGAKPLPTNLRKAAALPLTNTEEHVVDDDVVDEDQEEERPQRGKSLQIFPTATQTEEILDEVIPSNMHMKVTEMTTITTPYLTKETQDDQDIAITTTTFPDILPSSSTTTTTTTTTTTITEEPVVETTTTVEPEEPGLLLKEVVAANVNNNDLPRPRAPKVRDDFVPVFSGGQIEDAEVENDVPVMIRNPQTLASLRSLLTLARQR